MIKENPFLKMEKDLSESESKRSLAKALLDAEFSAGMQTGQYSEYHTEGEKVADHYKLIFNVMNAILHEDNDNAKERLSKSIQDALEKLDSSIKTTIKEYPSLMRYVVLTHDIAKREENRTFNVKKFKMPEDDLELELDSEVMDTAHEFNDFKNQISAKMAELEAKVKEMTKEIKTLEKAVKNKKTDPEQLVEAYKELEVKQEVRKQSQEEKAEKESELADRTTLFYDKLKSLGLNGAEITKYFGLGVGFVKHEEKSAETVKGMDIPEDVKILLTKLADDHIVPLNRFADKSMDNNTAATAYTRTYGEYSLEEFRLSMAMVALDILGSVRAEREPDLTPIENILRGKREAWIKERVSGQINDEVKKALEENPDYAEFKEVDMRDKKTPIEVKQKYSNMKKEVEANLRERLAIDYEEFN